MIKTCNKCGLERKHSKNQRWCRDCHHEYYENSTKKAGIDARQALFRAIITAWKDAPCVDCGIWYPSYVMQFDHLRDKHFIIARAVNVSLDRLVSEMMKCEVVCANCHAERTFGRSAPRAPHRSILPAVKPRTVKSIKIEKPRPRKVVRPDKESLLTLLWDRPSTRLGKEFGVSSRAIGKWAAEYGIPKPPRGYWSKDDEEKERIRVSMLTETQKYTDSSTAPTTALNRSI